MNKHFLQSKHWIEVKKALGNKVFEVDGVFMQATKIPVLNRYIGYIPRARLEDINLTKIFEAAKNEKCIYVSIDPDNLDSEFELDLNSEKDFILKKGKPVHLQDNLILNLTKSDEDFLKEMKQKHRYNLKLSQKKGVKVKIEDSSDAFDMFLKIYVDTMIRQGYTGRSAKYVNTVWETLKMHENANNKYTTIATAYFKEIPIVSWMLFLYEDTIYYPYGGSSDKFKNIMAPYSLVWEIIKWGKENGFKKFDLWGLDSDESDGYTRFKLGFGGEKVRYEDTIDLVIDSKMYSFMHFMNGLRNKFNFIKRFI